MRPTEIKPKSYNTSFEGIHYTPEGDLSIRVVGVPFGGPDYLGRRDLDNEYFDKSTDVGPLSVVLSYFHHGQDQEFGPEPTGVAQKVGQSEEGWLYDIIVHRNHRYKDLLKRLAEQGHLGVSSTPFQATAQKTEDGLWKTWHVIELGLTPTPANPDAKILVQKALNEMANKKSVEDQTKDEVQTPAEDEVVETQPKAEVAVETDVVDHQPEPSLQEMIEKAFENLNPDKEGSSTLIAELAQEIRSIREIQERMQEEQSKSIEEVKELRNAIPVLAETVSTYVAKALSGQVEEFAQKSKKELDIERQQRASSGKSHNGFVSILPANAPGMGGN